MKTDASRVPPGAASRHSLHTARADHALREQITAAAEAAAAAAMQTMLERELIHSTTDGTLCLHMQPTRDNWSCPTARACCETSSSPASVGSMLQHMVNRQHRHDCAAGASNRCFQCAMPSVKNMCVYTHRVACRVLVLHLSFKHDRAGLKAPAAAAAAAAATKAELQAMIWQASVVVA
jgi:hypothetical protein